MKKHVIFFHGGSTEDDYHADAKLVASLKSNLGADYAVHFPQLLNDGTPDLGRRKQISREISERDDHLILVGHSFGASMLLASLSEMKIVKKIAGIFLLGTPFWNGDEDWVQPFKLLPDFATQLDKKIPLHFYQCTDDEEVPLEHFTIYKHLVPWASFHEFSTGGHQFNDDLTIVTSDIKSI